jgi:hypothetical protein
MARRRQAVGAHKVKRAVIDVQENGISALTPGSLLSLLQRRKSGSSCVKAQGAAQGRDAARISGARLPLTGR